MRSQSLKLIKINDENEQVFKNLAHSYEAEFSNLTKKIPDENGVFQAETGSFPSNKYAGFLLYLNHKTPIGFCVANVKNTTKDIAEFYIIPVMRKQKFGFKLASMIFDLFPGNWQVRQIAGAENAMNFWRSVIKEYTQDQFEEMEVYDEDWGIVTKQVFVSGK